MNSAKYADRPNIVRLATALASSEDPERALERLADLLKTVSGKEIQEVQK